MIPGVIKKIYDAKKLKLDNVEIWGDGESRREFMFASDLADFIDYSINKIETMPQNINVGIGKDYSINEYYQIIADVIGYKGNFSHDLSKPSGMKRKLIDNSKMKEFGWNNITNLEDGIKKTLEYYTKTKL